MFKLLRRFRNPFFLFATGCYFWAVLSTLLLQAQPPGENQEISGDENPALCASCHSMIYASWSATLHARNKVGCNSCHGNGIEHRRIPVKDTLFRPENTHTCLKCHPEQKFSAPDLAKTHPQGNQYQEMWKERLLSNFVAGRATRLELFLLPDCPYGTMALQELLQLEQKYSNQFALHLTWMGSPEDLEEVPGSVRYHLAVHSLYPDYFEQYFMRGLEMPEETPWEKAAGMIGLPTEELSSWIKSEEATTLLQWDFERSEEKGITLSPTLLVNEYQFPGPFPGRSLRRLWGKAIGEPVEQLGECDSRLDCNWPWGNCRPGGAGGKGSCVPLNGLPVSLTLIDSLDCAECYSDPVISSAMQLFPGLEVRWLDAGKPGRGKDLAEKLNLKTLPAYIFDESLNDVSPAFSHLKPILKKREEGWLVDPAITASPLLWQRPREEGALELWFSPGQPASDNMEDIWREWLTAHPDRFSTVRVRFLLSGTSLEIQDLLSRYKKWGLGLEAYQEDLVVEKFPHPQSRAGGALVNNQVWIEGWSPFMISRALGEIENGW